MAVKSQTITESTPLLPTETTRPRDAFFKPIYRLLLCGFLVSFSFGVTQVPLIYVFRLMTCEAYYDNHPNPPSGHDRCDVRAIEAGTATAVAILGASTTFFGVANLFITRWGIKRFGVKPCLVMQVFLPAARLAIQNVGVMTGGELGIIIIQCSQIITVFGGPNGYMLCLNTLVADISPHKERTGALGRLQGCNMFGSAFGFLLGGILADVFTIITPFQVTLALFLAATFYVLFFVPHVPIKPEEKEQRPLTGAARLIGPLRSLLPADFILENGRVRREYGAAILACGAFLAVLATGYIPTMLQMYATDVFGFGTKRNSYLVAMHSFLRGLFLTFVFPIIISRGRALMEKRTKNKELSSKPTSGYATPDEQTQVAQAMQDEQEPEPLPPNLRRDQETFEFDLVFTRFSLLADGVLTLGASFVSQGWQMYLVAAFLPFGAGTASAAKGVILQMCSPNERTDALSAIAFVEMVARLSTFFVFGIIFAGFASIGKTYLVFTCNAAVALVGFLILLFCHFPQAGSTRIEAKQSDASEDSIS